jgi:nicotinamidase-related amidase
VIDLTNGFTDPQSALGSDLAAVIKETVRLLNEARALGIYTSIAYHNPEMEGGHWVRKIPSLAMLRFGAKAIEVDDRLGRRPSEPVLYRCFTSAFAGTHLQPMLQFLGIDALLVCGTSTSGCIRATAADAVQLGYRCIVPESAVGDRAEGPHQANLFDIDAKYGDVMPTDAVLSDLSACGARVGASFRRS